MQHPKICFIGAGNMAGAIIAGLVKSGYPPEQIIASNKSIDKLNQLQGELDILITLDNKEAAKNADVIILAVKPAVVSSVCLEIAKVVNEQFIISVAAGITTKTIKKYLQSNAPMARVMPNTPCLLSKGAIGVYTEEITKVELKGLIEMLFQSLGELVWLDSEHHIDIVTALSGSGPAYYFYLTEALIEAGINQGLPPETSRQLVMKTAEGAAAMLNSSPYQSAQDLRIAVTSPKGTTEAALNVLNKNNFKTLIDEAIDAGVLRGIELSKDFS